MTTSTVKAYSKKLQAWKEEIQEKTGKTAEQLYGEREKRIRDAIELREPDRVPLLVIAEANSRLGVLPSAAYYNPVVWKAALIQEIINFEPDIHMSITGSSGRSMDTLGVINKLWPGGPLPPEYEYQFVEGEYMKADEYDHFLSDPSDFMIRCFLPRVYKVLAPLSKLPPINQTYFSFDFITALFSSPEYKEMAKSLAKAGRELEKYRSEAGDIQDDLASLGFVEFGHGGVAGFAPFDIISSFFRGMKGSMLDMYRQPEKLLQACDAVLKRQIATAVPADPGKRGNPKRAGIPLWRGDNSFMSDKQFERFYWPGLKKAMQAAIDLGYVPIPFFEAPFGKRLEHLLELPKGKVAIVVENADIIPAREMLGGHTCIIGKPPVSLQCASIQETLDFYRDLLVDKKCGKGGGLILRLVLPQNAPVKDLQKMAKQIREYCRY